jgi:CheY-like chemotaxis protein
MSAERTILLAEDDENDVLFLQRAFAQAGITTPLQIARDGQAAIDFLAGLGSRAERPSRQLPRLAMLDLKMPRKNGMEVLEWIRSQDGLCGLPVIIFSSSVDPGEMRTAYHLGANAFVSKPSGTPERTELARTIKGFWLTFNRVP